MEHWYRWLCRTLTLQSVQISSEVYIFLEDAEKKNLCGYVVINWGQKHLTENIKRIYIFESIQTHQRCADAHNAVATGGFDRRLRSAAVRWRIPPSDPVLPQQSPRHFITVNTFHEAKHGDTMKAGPTFTGWEHHELTAMWEVTAVWLCNDLAGGNLELKVTPVGRRSRSEYYHRNNTDGSDCFHWHVRPCVLMLATQKPPPPRDHVVLHKVETRIVGGCHNRPRRASDCARPCFQEVLFMFRMETVTCARRWACSRVPMCDMLPPPWEKTDKDIQRKLTGRKHRCHPIKTAA